MITNTFSSLHLAALVCLLRFVMPVSAQTWTQTTAPSTNWVSVASSADGNKLVAAVKGGPIFTSTDSGTNWMQTSAPNTNWACLASSADGVKLAAAVSVFSGNQFEAGGPIYTSSDSGATWTQTSAPIINWASLACSADGSNWVAVVGGLAAPAGPIFTSADAGDTWTATPAPTVAWTSVASSADGIHLVAVGGGRALTSSDSGATWISRPDGALFSVASSADGNLLVAGTDKYPAPGGSAFYVSTSTNSGAAWAVLLAGPGGRAGVASSCDGTKLVAVIARNTSGTGGPILVSMDSGTSWTSNGSLSTDWSSVASSADGNRLVATIDGGGIWTLRATPTPSLWVTHASTNLVLSWIVPTTDFTLQHCSDLATADWTDVTNSPTLNLTNLQSQVTVPEPTGNRFYRLKH